MPLNSTRKAKILFIIVSEQINIQPGVSMDHIVYKEMVLNAINQKRLPEEGEVTMSELKVLLADIKKRRMFRIKNPPRPI